MALHVSKALLQKALLEMNSWHPNVPLIFVFSKQRPSSNGQVDGGAQAVRGAYDDLFNLDRIGIRDESRKFFLHVCHGKAGEFPYALKKPTDAYGKTHQRIIKDTFGQNFLERISEGKYKIEKDFTKKVLQYFGLERPLDLKPLVLFYFWNNISPNTKVRQLWEKFSKSFGLDQAPFSQVFTCSDFDQVVETESGPNVDVKGLFLPNEYGTEKIDVEFWKRFRVNLENVLKEIKWQGPASDLAASIATGLLNDQSIFLLGPPGTGKTTLVHDGILPALRLTYGSSREIGFSAHTLTPSSTCSDLLGFQGLDGDWVMGPLGKAVLFPAPKDTPVEGEEEAPSEQVDSSPMLLFFDEANRVDIEGLLAPLQPAFDRMQRRLDPGVIQLGKNDYITPKKVWRIFAGNSPSADMGRREQSRPFKRRTSLCVTPDPMAAVMSRSASFRSLAFDLLERGSTIDDPEIAEPCLLLFGQWKSDTDRIEDLRIVLEGVSHLPQVAVTVGLVESVLFRTASHAALGRDLALDSALCQSLVGLLCGQPSILSSIAETAIERKLPQFGAAVKAVMEESKTGMNFEVNPIL